MACQHRNDFFKYRKSIGNTPNGSVSGISYNRFRSNPTSPLSSGNGKPAGYHHDLYMHGNPREYRPNINAPSVDWNEYEIYEPMNMPHFSHSDTGRQLHSPDFSNARPVFNSMPADDLTLTEQFLQAMGRRNSVEDVPVCGMDNRDIESSVDSGNIPDFKDLSAALTQLSKVFPQDHPDIVNLKNAMHQLSEDNELPIIEENLSEIKDESSFDSFMESEKIFNQQMQVLEKSFEFPVAEPSGIQALQMPDELEDRELTIEEIVAQEDNSPVQFAEPGMMQQEVMPENQDINQIEQAIDQLKEEPDSFSMQEDPYLVAQQMFDQQMQFMNNQFTMHGPM